MAGAYLEAVSPHEHSLAIKYGAQKGSIIYNGVCINASSIMHAAAIGSKINFDNLSELNEFLERWNSKKDKVNVGLGVTFDIGNGINSHFGFAGCDFY